MYYNPLIQNNVEHLLIYRSKLNMDAIILEQASTPFVALRLTLRRSIRSTVAQTDV